MNCTHVSLCLIVATLIESECVWLLALPEWPFHLRPEWMEPLLSIPGSHAVVTDGRENITKVLPICASRHETLFVAWFCGRPCRVIDSRDNRDHTWPLFRRLIYMHSHSGVPNRPEIERFPAHKFPAFLLPGDTEINSNRGFYARPAATLHFLALKVARWRQ